MSATEALPELSDFATRFVQPIEDSVARQGFFSFNEDEVRELAGMLQEQGVNLEALRGRLPDATYDRQEKMRRRVLEALGWSPEEFFDLVNEVIALPGGAVGEGAAIQDARQRILERARQPLKTAGSEWQGFSPEQKKYVFRSLGVLETLYDTLCLCRMVGSEHFDEAACFTASKISSRLIRGEQKTSGTSVALQKEGLDYGQVRLLPPGAYRKIIDKISRKQTTS